MGPRPCLYCRILLPMEGLFLIPTLAALPAFFIHRNQNPSANKEAILDVMYLTAQTNPVLGATFTWQLVPQNYFNALPAGQSSIKRSSWYAFGLQRSRALQVLLQLMHAESPTIHTSAYTYQGTTDAHAFIRKYLDTTKIPQKPFWLGYQFYRYPVYRCTDA